MKENRFLQEVKKWDCKIFYDVPLRDLTTFQIGGKAACVIEPFNFVNLEGIAKLLQTFEEPYIVLGGGANTLAPDAGTNKIILHCSNRFSDIQVEGDCVIADAGATLARVCNIACKNSLAGMSFAWGIPGSIGGAAFMNAGAYGGEMKDIVKQVWYVENGESKTVMREECDFGYRHSLFTDKKAVITRVALQLNPGDKAEIKAEMDDILNRRYTKQPMDKPSAGSAFKRPVGGYASALIDECGLRGYRVGDAAVSEKHCGFIVNLGSATSADVLQLIADIQKTVKDKTGFDLEPEVRLMGE